MTDAADVDGTSLTHRVVLLGLTDRETGDATPAHAGEVRRSCTERLDAVAGDVVGTLSEAEVARSLNELEAEGLVDATRDATTATGKGRPRYTLAVERDTLLDELSTDERVRPLVDVVAD